MIDHATLLKWVTSSEDATIDSRASSEKCRDYYDSIQLTDAEIAALKKRGQAPVVINRVKPKMDGLFGMEKANRTTAKAFPRTPQHQHDAEAASEAIRYVLQDNHYPISRSAAWENMCIEGTGGVEVTAKDIKGEIRIKIYFVQWDRIIYDPHSRRKNFSDARYLGQVVWMDYDEAAALYPDGASILNDMVSESATYDDKPRWMDGTRDRVKIVELYYREDGEVKYCCFTRGGYLKHPKISPFKDEDGQTEWPYEFASAFVDRDGNRYGAMKQLLDVQDEVNKRRSKALHLMSVRQVRVERGAVEDINQTRSELAKPDGLIETTPGMEFEVLKTGDMAAAQFNLLTEAKQEIDTVGVNAAMSGKLEGSASGVALNARIQSGQTEVSSMFDVIKHLDICVYRKVWNRIRQYWKEEKWIRVTDDDENIKFIGINRQTTKGDMLLQQAQEKKLPPEQMMMLQQQIAQDPMMQQTVTQNNVSELDVDIIISDAPDVQNMEVEQFQGLAEVIKSGAPPVLIEALIQASSIPRKEQLLKRLKGEGEVPPQMQQKMQQMQEELQKVTEENQKLKTQDAEGMEKLKVESQLQSAKLQSEQELAKQEFALSSYKQEQELKLAREKAEAEITLKRQVAAADLEIENSRMERQNKQAQDKMNFEQKIKLSESPELAEVEVIPKVAEALMQFAQAFEAMTKTMQGASEIQQETLQVQQEALAFAKSPKNISLSNVRRDGAGHVTGATVNPRLQ